MKKSKTPRLRFPEFKNDWTSKEVSQLLKSVSKKVDVDPGTVYQEIGIRSHGKGIFHKEPVTGKELGNKRVFWIVEEAFILNIVFAWEQAIAKTTSKEVGLIASHRFPMYEANKDTAYLDFIRYFFLTKRGKYLLEMASPGGAGRNRTLGKTRFMELCFRLPNLEEQNKIADFLLSVDQKIQQLKRKKELLGVYKKAVMQKLFSQEIRFKDENGEEFPEWEYKEIGDISDRITEKNEDDEYDFVLTNSAVQGVVSQTEYFDKSIANKSNLGGYYIVKKDDFVYNPRISNEAPVGPIKRNNLKTGVMSPLYSVFRINEKHLDFFEYFFETTLWHRYMHSVANFGARHDRMNITTGDFQKLPIPLPSESERKIITAFINSISEKLYGVNQKLELAEKFKNGLLQQMFV